MILWVLIACFASGQSPSLSFDLKKPPKFENKTLGSEKTGNKKFTPPRHFIQNTVTHYNYFFNANNKLNEVLERAKIAHKEDYTQLLPFYNYSLDETAQYKTELDSVIYKSTAGILIHDLRNDWIDNLYLLIGKAYYLRNSLDSAYLTFQYINYAFSPKEKGGYDKVIGSNADEGNIFSISTKEKQNILKEAFSRPPSRNESLLWQIKTYLAMDALPEASSLIETLKNDPQFPDRLKSGLEEALAFYFYKQLAYDSAAAHLALALDNAENKQEQARWEYLLAQLYERAGNPAMAEKYYDQTIRHTIDPIMEVYARLNSIRQNKNGDKNSIDNAVNELIRMARRDRYLFYRDIIYYTAATIELERNNPEAATALLQRSIQTSTSNPAQRSKSFLALGDIYFSQKKYTPAKGAYDSVITQYMLPDDAKLLAVRTAALEKIVVQQAVLDRQDSLRRIAALPDKERETFLRNMAKRLRRERGISESDLPLNPGGFMDNNPAASDMFSNNASKSNWSFADASLKGKGLNDFKTRWGNRPNVDNWRRQAAVAQAATFNRPPDPAMAAGMRPGQLTAGGDLQAPAGEINYESLLNNLPLTPEKQKISADSVEHALFELGRAYMSGLEDYYSAIDALEKLVQDFSASTYQEEALFNLYYCYLKVGKPANQLQIQKLLATKYPGGKFSSLLTSSRPSLSPDSLQKTKATQQYQDIYNLFIEGNFDQAVTMKRTADSVYGQHYWTPQLLYIEGVYYIRQRDDSTAKAVLNKIIQLYPSSPMAPKTANLLSVLSRRKEIEDYLTKLQITRPADDAVVIVDDEKPAPKKQPVVVPPPVKDTPAVVKEEPLKSANATVVKKEVTGTKTPVTIKTGKAGKADSLQIVKRDLPDPLLRNDTVAIVKREEPPVVNKTVPPAKADSTDAQKNAAAILNKPKAADSAQVAKKNIISDGVYSEDAAEAHYILFVLNKVDPVYVNEARNAFNRYHREQYYGKAIEVTTETLNEDIRLVVMKGFGNAAEALDYIEKAKKRTASDIVPWLTPQKYSFLTTTASNLEALRRTKDTAGFRTFMQKVYPGKF